VNLCRSIESGLDGIKTGVSSVPEDQVAAQTAKCLLSIDGKPLVNERCNVEFSPDGRGILVDAGKYYAVVSLTLDRKGSPTILTAYWNRGSGAQRPAYIPWSRQRV
jgi:hypothetical protein